MISILSLVTSIKDYVEVVNKFIEYDSVNINYTELGSILTFFLISIKNCLIDFFSFSWLLKENLWSLPIIIPQISSAMISEISVLDGYFHNAFNFLDTPVSYGMPVQNGFISCLEKLTIGLINSFFLFLPTSTAHIITLRRFVMQGLEVGYISGLGTIAGNMFWLASVILGCRFFVIPWLSLDTFRYVLGFILLVKYMWDTYNERKITPSLGGNVDNSSFLSKDNSEGGSRSFGVTSNQTDKTAKRKIFLLTFLLALTEQTSIYPFISNLSMNPESSILETFASGFPGVATSALNMDSTLSALQGASQDSNGFLFICSHLAYLLGIGLGSLSLLHLSCWFWENPAFKFYMWVISSFKISTSFYYRVLNFGFLYLTMLSAICSIPYYGLDYTITNPLGYVSDDRIIQDKVVLETSFLGTKASDRNTRRNRGRHGRRERWKRRIRKYRTFDASLYDQGIYDLFTIEDLNYGFDRFWLRRKLRNHRVRFRFFPGPWMRSFKKQLAKPRLESYTGPRIEFFRILFEQVYHPSFHAYTNKKNINETSSLSTKVKMGQTEKDKNILLQKGKYSLYYNTEPLFNTLGSSLQNKTTSSLTLPNNTEQSAGIYNQSKNESNLTEKSRGATLRKFVRKFDNRIKTLNSFSNSSILQKNNSYDNQKPIYSKQWKNFISSLRNKNSLLFSNNSFSLKGSQQQNAQLDNFNLSALMSNTERKSVSILDYLDEKENKTSIKSTNTNSLPLITNQFTNTMVPSSGATIQSKKDLQILQYRSLLTENKESLNFNKTESFNKQNQFGGGLAKQNAIKQNKINESLMLLHPLKFYLQKEAGFKRKLRYYTPNIYRKFSIENNAPYFRVMMKRYFYNYKPTLRWERTMKTASLRKARRKTTRIPRKLQNTNINPTSLADFTSGSSYASNASDSPATNSLSSLPSKGVSSKERTSKASSNMITNDSLINKKSDITNTEQNLNLPLQYDKNLLLPLRKPTYNYSVVSKRANRYRYEIYKDVLQHWYYSPFNRILLKLDVDSFIRRQPNSHFLTSKEENLLHLRRQLLCEHYNTLRWYTNMEHYRSMKTQLNGGTKSFASRSYNQQFTGTFKKVRHLFAITPSFSNVLPLQPSLINTQNVDSPLNPSENTKSSKDSLVSKETQSLDGKNNSSNFSFGLWKDKKESTTEDQNSVFFKESQYLLSNQPNVLKFDQPLYNEYNNNSSNPLLNPLIIHEELLSNQPSKVSSINEASYTSNDLVAQSQKIIREYLIQTRSVRQDYIKQLLNENNYAELTKFIYKGQKTRGSQPVTNQQLFNDQEKNYLLTLKEQNEILSNKNSASETREANGANFANETNSLALLGTSKASSSTFNLASLNNKLQNKENVYLTYLKKWKRNVNDQESLKNYLTRRLDKREKRKQKKEKQLLTKLQRLENWGFIPESTSSVNNSSNELLTSGLQKSILEGMFVLKNNDPNAISTVLNKDCSLSLTSNSGASYGNCTTNSLPFGKGNNTNEKSLWKSLLLSKIQKNNDQQSVSTQLVGITNSNVSSANSFVGLQDLTLRFNNIKYAQKLKLSNNLKASIQATREFIKTQSSINNIPFKTEEKTTSSPALLIPSKASVAKTSTKKIQLYTSFKNKIVGFSTNNLKTAAKNISNKTQGFISSFKSSANVTNLFKPIKRKSLKDWRQKERVLNKQKRSRKEFKLLNKKTESISTFVDRNELESALISKQKPDRKKRIFNNQNDGLSSVVEQDNQNTPVIFKRKRSPQRRSRVRRNRGVFKKRNLTDSLKKDFVLFYNEKDLDLKAQYYDKFNERLYGEMNPNFASSSALLGTSKASSATKLTEQDTLENENPVYLKQRKSKQRKERYWKQKRSKYSQKRRKYRKRRPYAVVKIRSLNKQFKRIKNQIEIQNWWVNYAKQKFVSSIQASNEALWQIEKDKLIQQKLSNLSTSDILQRDSFTNNSDINNASKFNSLQIGNTDFKPLALPFSIRLQQQTTQGNNIQLFEEANSQQNSQIANLADLSSTPGTSYPFGVPNPKGLEESRAPLINKLYESLFIKNNNDASLISNDVNEPQGNPFFSEFLVPNTNLPFYAGWDESLRKLIVTNRMLSRREAGFSLPRISNNDTLAKLDPLTNMGVEANLMSSANLTDQSSLVQQAENFIKDEFTMAPLQGMNAATTLYWQIPFTTYDPDQFFALGMDGFSPIGWRKFLLRHSILKTWLTQSTTSGASFTSQLKSSNLDNSFGSASSSLALLETSKASETIPSTLKGETKELISQTALVVKTRSNILKDFSLLSLNDQQKQNILLKTQTDQNTTNSSLIAQKYQQNKNAFAISRRLKKRYRRVKKHPRTPVWFPSGPLLNQVLPVHYIYVFYKRARLPRDRYLKRRLINVKNMNTRFSSLNANKANSSNSSNSSQQVNYKQVVPNVENYDFTLRKRLKPRRKYHLKRDYYASNVVIPRRFKFMSINSSDVQKWRPLNLLKINKPISEVVNEQQLIRRSAQQKQRSAKQQPNMRVKQLRRRVQRQILRSVWRYRPRAGGFVWPGDYLKLELVKAPKLQKSAPNNIDATLSSSEARSAKNENKDNSAIKKQKRKKKRTLVEWQIQPKKYLYEKHNLKVLKKKLLNAQRSLGSNTTTLNILRNSI